MNNVLNKDLILPNGNKIPMLALGTWLIHGDDARLATKTAINLGYRHIDTAQAYQNEEYVGLGIKESGIKREDIFVTSKVAAEIKSYNEAKASIDESLAKLGLDYIDLMIIHCPQPWQEYGSAKRYEKENKDVWRALEEAYLEGKVRAIGVSNFSEYDIKNILEDCKIRPMVNQILTHIGDTPIELIKYCESENILLEAYSPIAHGKALDNPKILKMASKYGVSIAQLCIRYCLQLGMITLPKSTNPEHMKANGEVDFEISSEDMLELMDY